VLGQKRIHTARRDQTPNQRGGVQQFTIGTGSTLYPTDYRSTPITTGAPARGIIQDTPSSALLGCVVERTFADVAGAGHDGEQLLQLTKHGVEGQAGASAVGSRRSRMQNAWASTVRVTWRCQPTKLRPSKWSIPSPVLSSR